MDTALSKCPECQEPVAKQAVICPHCAAPIPTVKNNKGWKHAISQWKLYAMSIGIFGLFLVGLDHFRVHLLTDGQLGMMLIGSALIGMMWAMFKSPPS